MPTLNMNKEIPSKCRAMVAEKPGADLVLREVDVQLPQKGEILIKTLACGVCHTDLSTKDGLLGTQML